MRHRPQLAPGAVVAMSGLYVAINKMDNGYTMELYDPPKFPEEEEEAEIVDEGEKIDKMIDGMVSFAKYFNNRSTGENWKEEDDKEKLREGFKVLFPSFNRGMGQVKAYQAKNEQRVFENKKDLIEYLEKNL